MGLTLHQSGPSIHFSFGRFTTEVEIEVSALLVINCLESKSGTDPD